MKKFWNIPILIGYLYAITILVQGGFNSYFNIPLGFITASIVHNTIAAFILFKATLELAAFLGWWWLVVGPVIIAVGLISYIKFNDYKKIFIWIATIMALLFLYKALDFGEFLAKWKTNFLILSPECHKVNGNENYIVAELYDGKAVLVPYDITTNKLGDGFMLKEISDLPCKLQYKDIGFIIK